MSIINIPSQYEEGIDKLMELDDQQVNEIVEFLKSQPPTLKIQELAIDCANTIESLSSSNIEKILEFILALFVTAEVKKQFR